MTTTPDPFDSAGPDRLAASLATDADGFVVSLEGYEGPLDILLNLARTQRVDLAHISILTLVEQYLAFIAQARTLRLELAADYLVMAAWLAYLKSRLLLPKDDRPEDEPSAEELAARLQAQLLRLDAMREAGTRLMARDRLGRDVFARGKPEGLLLVRHGVFDVTLYELLKAYAAIAAREAVTAYTPQRRAVFSLDEAIARLERLIGLALDWTELLRFLPDAGEAGAADRRSALASTFVASLEMARLGRADLQQVEPFGPLLLRRRTASPPEAP
jgi:segregation and condensation protein A